MNPHLSVRELQHSDIDFLTQYWFTADREFLAGMGADIDKLPKREEWVAMLNEQLDQGYREKKAYCIIWLINGRPAGHSNVNRIVFGEEASMHLHLWSSALRQKGMGAELVKMTVPYFFKNLELKKVYSEPYALNPAPNKTLEKAGFQLVKEYVTTPGFINFEQPVKRWEMDLETFWNIKS